jgi:hypothetical protein
MAFFVAGFFFADNFFFGSDFFFAARLFGAAFLLVFLAEAAFLAADFFRVGFFLLTVFFLRAGFFLAMPPSLSNVFVAPLQPAQQLVFELKFPCAQCKCSSATVVPRCSIFIIKTSSEAHDNPISLAFGKAVAPSALPVIAAVLFWS